MCSWMFVPRPGETLFQTASSVSVIDNYCVLRQEINELVHVVGALVRLCFGYVLCSFGPAVAHLGVVGLLSV